MRIIYLSTDELNQSLVQAWGEQQGIEIECPKPNYRARERICDGMLLDLDHTTSDWLETLAERLETARLETCPVVVHGYSAVGDAFRSAFCGRDVLVSAQLRPGLLRDLARPSNAPAPEQAEDGPDFLTWVDLV